MSETSVTGVILHSQLVWLDGCTRPPPDSPYLGLVTDNGSGSLVSPKIISWSKSSIRRKWQYSASQRNLHHLPPSYLFRQSPRYPARYPHYHEATGNPRWIEERCGGSDEGRSLASFRNLQPYGVTFHTFGLVEPFEGSSFPSFTFSNAVGNAIRIRSKWQTKQVRHPMP